MSTVYDYLHKNAQPVVLPGGALVFLLVPQPGDTSAVSVSYTGADGMVYSGTVTMDSQRHITITVHAA